MKQDMMVKLQKSLKTTQISFPAKLNHTFLITQDKNTLIAMLDNNMELRKSVESKVEELKSEQMDKQRQMLKFQQMRIETVQVYRSLKKVMKPTCKT